MQPIVQVILFALSIYGNIVIASAILSWLIAFNIVNMRNNLVRSVATGLYQITEPLLRPIRRILPNMGTIDISPVVLYLLILLIEMEIREYILPNVF